MDFSHWKFLLTLVEFKFDYSFFLNWTSWIVFALFVHAFINFLNYVVNFLSNFIDIELQITFLDHLDFYLIRNTMYGEFFLNTFGCFFLFLWNILFYNFIIQRKHFFNSFLLHGVDFNDLPHFKPLLLSLLTINLLEPCNPNQKEIVNHENTFKNFFYLHFKSTANSTLFLYWGFKTIYQLL